MNLDKHIFHLVPLMRILVMELMVLNLKNGLKKIFLSNIKLTCETHKYSLYKANKGFLKKLKSAVNWGNWDCSFFKNYLVSNI